MTNSTWSRTEEVEVLDVPGGPARAWSFYWPGHVVVQPWSDGLTWVVRGERHAIPPGSVLVAPPGAGHLRVLARSHVRFRVLFERPCGEIEAAPGRVHLPQLWSSPEGLTEADPLFGAAVRHLAGVAPSSIRISPMVSRARRWLSARPETSIVLRELGVVAGGVGRSHLCRSFQSAMGLPPYRFRAQLRIARARRLLAEGHDCSAVAAAMGFCDQSHFARTFKELSGATPGSYRLSCGPQLAGIVKTKRVPVVSSDVTAIVPPWASAMRSTM